MCLVLILDWMELNCYLMNEKATQDNSDLTIILMNLNHPCPAGGWEYQVAERFPECNGKYVYSTMEKRMFHKDMTLSTFPLASYWAFKLWNFHHACTPHSQPPCLYPLITWA